MSNQLTLDSIVDLSHLSIQKEDDEEYTVGDLYNDIFIRIPYEGVLVIELLNKGLSIEESQKEIENKYKIEIDVLDFVELLLELKLIHKLDGKVLMEIIKTDMNLGWKQKIGKLFFRKETVIMYTILSILTVGMFCYEPSLLPNYKDMFLFESVGISLFIFFIVSWLLTFLHEIGHYFAAAKENVPVRFQLSIRWFWIVIEADMNKLWSQEKQKRYIPFLAGLCWDMVVLFIAVLIQFFMQNQEFIYHFARMIILIQMYRVVSQFAIFLRTDFYYILITYFNSSNLTQSATAYLLKSIVASKNNIFVNLPEKEKKLAKYYSYFYVLGGIAASLLFIFYTVPAGYTAINGAVQQISSYQINSINFWDGFILLSLTLFEVALWCIGAWKSRIRNTNSQLEV
ncbi:hypothetical protein WAG12_03635 [Bacillus cereus]|uniref:hypothetical protein n=1 Tax=Bacillus cereus group TaxID=86661 RepID=UPI003037034D